MLAAMLVIGSGCSSDDDSADPVVVFDDTTCEANVTRWPGDGSPIVVRNESSKLMALIVGTYNEGHSRTDLVDYAESWEGGSARPDFVSATEIREVGPRSERPLLLEADPGLYFAVCMAMPDTMAVADDVVIPG